MDPTDARDEQIARYRRMTGEERLGIALALHDLACDVAREGIRAGRPSASHEEIERELRRRIALGYRR